MIELTDFIQQYGYVAVFVGTFFEGESVALLGGFLAHGEYLNLPLVMVVTFVGSFCGDQTAYWLGRRYGSRWKPKSAVVQRRLARADELLHRYQIPVCWAFVSFTASATPRRSSRAASAAFRLAASSRSTPSAPPSGPSQSRCLGYYFGQTAESLLGTRSILRQPFRDHSDCGRLSDMVGAISDCPTPGRTIERNRR